MAFKDEIETIPFQCSKVGRAVVLTIIRRAHFSAESDQPTTTNTQRTECTGRLHCGIVSASGVTDWGSCEYPNLKSKGVL